MSKRFDVFTVFTGIDKLSAPMAKISKTAFSFASKMGPALDTMKGIDSTVSTLGKKVLAGAAVASGGLGMMVHKGAEFEQIMINAAVKFPGEIRKGTPAFEELAKVASDIGANTEFSASEAAQGLEYLAQAGFNAKQAMVAMPSLVDMATASSMSLAVASNIAADAMGAFGLHSEDAVENAAQLQRVSDVFGMAANRTNTDVEGLWEALQKVAPVATLTGSSLEETAAIAGVLANAGLKGSEAGTALKNVMLSIAKPSTEASKVFSEFGVSLQGADGSARKVTDVLQELGDKIPKDKQAAAFTTIFGREAVTGAANIAAMTQGVGALSQELLGAQGYTKNLASIMRDSTEGRIKSLQSVAEGFVLDLFGNSSGEFAKALDQATAWLRDNGPAIAQKFGAAVKWVADNFEMLISIGKQIVVVAAAIKIVTAAMTVMNALASANPWVLLIGALVAGAMLIIANWDKVKAWFVSLGASIKAWFVSVVNWFSSNIGSLLTVLAAPFLAIPILIVKNWDKIKGWISGFWDWFKAGGAKWLAVLAAPFLAIPAMIYANWERIRGWMTGFWNWLKEDGVKWAVILAAPFLAIPAMIYSNWEGIKSFFLGVFEYVVETFKALPGVLSGFFSAAWADVLSGARELWATMLEMLADIVEKAQSVYKTVAPYIPGVNGNELDSAATGLRDMATQARNTADAPTQSELLITDATKQSTVKGKNLAPNMTMQKTGGL